MTQRYIDRVRQPLDRNWAFYRSIINKQLSALLPPSTKSKTALMKNAVRLYSHGNPNTGNQFRGRRVEGATHCSLPAKFLKSWCPPSVVHYDASHLIRSWFTPEAVAATHSAPRAPWCQINTKLMRLAESWYMFVHTYITGGRREDGVGQLSWTGRRQWECVRAVTTTILPLQLVRCRLIALRRRCNEIA